MSFFRNSNVLTTSKPEAVTAKTVIFLKLHTVQDNFSPECLLLRHLTSDIMLHEARCII